MAVLAALVAATGVLYQTNNRRRAERIEQAWKRFEWAYERRDDLSNEQWNAVIDGVSDVARECGETELAWMIVEFTVDDFDDAINYDSLDAITEEESRGPDNAE
ncbi:hypothetical protein [Gordonia rhizosphera]|uniref:Uncharacterized protein n=1 Tax=Gordonia rhizosphera NBRC 16068 TaxID=1108045 RepID=K6WUA4_9ACTN|nr:hypothetical protein [Gordonia rhizosphera]GAB90139.1 hypothetical protein GORHZ_085_00060 [Gordonia rhizosphera NBRC 16068]